MTATSASDSLPFFDNFDGAPNQLWTTGAITWIYADGCYTIAIVDPDVELNSGSKGVALVGDNSWQTYRLEVEIDLGNTVEQNRAGVVFHAQDSRNYLALVFNDNKAHRSHRDDAAWYFVVDGEETEVNATSNSDYPKDKPFTITVEVRGNQRYNQKLGIGMKKEAAYSQA